MNLQITFQGNGEGDARMLNIFMKTAIMHSVVGISCRQTDYLFVLLQHQKPHGCADFVSECSDRSDSTWFFFKN